MSRRPVIITPWEWLQMLVAFGLMILFPMICGWGGVLFDAVLVFVAWNKPRDT